MVRFGQVQEYSFIKAIYIELQDRNQGEVREQLASQSALAG